MKKRQKMISWRKNARWDRSQAKWVERGSLHAQHEASKDPRHLPTLHIVRHELQIVNSKVKNTKQWTKESKVYHSKCSSSPSKRIDLNGSMNIPRQSNNYQRCSSLSQPQFNPNVKKNSNFAKPLKFCIHRIIVENLKREG